MALTGKQQGFFNYKFFSISSPNFLPAAEEVGALNSSNYLSIRKRKEKIKYEQALRGLFTIGTSTVRRSSSVGELVPGQEGKLPSPRLRRSMEKVGGKLGLKNVVKYYDLSI